MTPTSHRHAATTNVLAHTRFGLRAVSSPVSDRGLTGVGRESDAHLSAEVLTLRASCDQIKREEERKQHHTERQPSSRVLNDKTAYLDRDLTVLLRL